MRYLLSLFDKNLLDVFNKDIKHPVFDLFFPLVTRLGEVAVIFPLCLLIFVFDRVRGKRTVGMVAIVYFLSRLVTLALKTITHRSRPFMVYPDLHLPGGGVSFYSFPSAHTTLITAVAFVLGNKYENWQWCLWLVVALVGISRMYMGLHYPTDVAGGMIIGLAIGYFTNYLEKVYDRHRSGGRLK